MKTHQTITTTPLILLAMIISITSVHSQSGTWTNNTLTFGTNRLDTVWSDPTNWLNGVVSDGSGSSAFLNTINILAGGSNATIFVTADATNGVSLTNGNIYFGDTVKTDGVGNWVLLDSGLPLTLDSTTSPEVVIDVDLARSNVNNLVVNWATATINANLTSTNVLVKSGPNHLILNPTAGNSHSGGMVLSNGMAQLGIANQAGTANSAVPGSGPITFRGGSLRLQNAAIPGNSPGNGGAGIPGLGNPVIVEAGQVGTIYLPPRAFPAISSAITGSGTLNLVVDFVRDDFSADMTAFSGKLNVMASARGNGDFRFGSGMNVNTFATVPITFTNNGVNANTVFMYSQIAATPTIAFGDLAATIPGIVTVQAATGQGGNAFIMRVGGLNNSSTFSGNFNAQPIGIIKEGTGTWALSGTAIEYTGITVISNGVLQIGSGTSGKLGRSAVVSNYSAIAFGRTDTALAVTNIVDGPGALIQSGSGRTTLSPSGGNNTYTGKTYVTNGTLAIANQTALGAAPVGYVADHLTLNGGTLAATTSLLIDGSTRGITLGVNGGGLGADGANTLTVGNIIAGSGNLTINNSGTVAPTVVNSFTGKTILQSGTLVLNSETPLGAAPGVATADQIRFNGGTLRSSATFAIDDANRGLTFAAASTISPDVSTTLTISEPTAGTGSLTKAGAGTLVLNGAGGHTGSTLINQGTLAIGASGSTASSLISISPGATLDVSATSFTLGSGQTLTGNGSVVGNATAGSGSTLSAGTSIGALSFANNLSLSGGATNVVEINNATNDIINVAGNLALAGLNTIRLDLLEPLTAGTHVLIKYGGTLTSGGAANLVIAGYPVSRVIPTLVHNVGNKSIDLVLTGSPLAIVWQGGLNGNAWDINTTANWVGPETFFNGDGVTFDNTGAANSMVNLTTTLQPGSITVSSATDYTFSGSGKISAGATLNKASANTLNVLTINDNSGITTISGGTVQVGNGTVSGSLGSGNIVNNAALAYNLPDTRTVTGQISGTGSLTVQAGTVVLTGNNSYGGTVINAAGTVEVGNGGASGSLGAGGVTDNGALVFRRTGTVTNSGSISGSGSLSVRSGTVVLAANNSYAGETTVASGTLQVGAGGTVGTLGTSGSVTVTNSGTLAFNRSDSLTNAVTILGTNGNLGQHGSGTLVITNDANNYGGTVITNGRLQLGDGVNASGRLGRGTITVTSPGTLALNRPDVYTLTNLITGSGSVAQVGPTNLIVTTAGGANTYSGGTTISNSLIEFVAPVTAPVLNGVQQVNGSGLGSGVVTFIGNSFLQFHWANQTDPDGGGAGNFPNPVNVPAGNTGTFWLPGRMEFSSAVSGAGTINLGVNYVRGNISGSWSNFFGQLNVVTNVPNTNNVAHDFRLFNTNGFPNAKLHLSAGTTMYWRGTANSVVPIGELSGEEGSLITGTGGAEGGNNVTWRVGGLGNSSTYGGTIGGSVFVGLTKVGGGTLRLTGVNGHLGMTTISNGVLAIATNSLAINGEILSSTNITIVSPGVLNVLERTDASFPLGSAAAQILAGNGTVLGNLNVGGLGTVSPGFSIGTLTVSSNVSLLGANYFVEINSAAAQTSDRIVARDVDLASAIITVTNIGNSLKTGDTFQIIQASGTISGAPASVTGGLPPGPGGNWDLSNLNVNGTIRAILPPSPTLTNSVSGGGTTLDFAWDAAYIGWRLYVQTNSLNVGISTNWVAIPGTEATTTSSMPIDKTSGTVFYRLAYP